MKELNYFIDKPITVITNKINRNFNETQSIDYFTGICEQITENGIFTRHPITGCKNFIFFSSMIGIFEEQEVTEEQIDKINNDVIKTSDDITFNQDNKININNLDKLIR